ncbi:PREDICTED: 26S proteasome non-ATPase regulatory subunit 10-like isoform X1 [Ceratosolen solmsi marchali]|uniref:26S proteasome non-ATPase regulatory subunit 10-like isoform X1 n=2 Tax=Ceratosolen solmsi marchali TaxID=326594 RepID=A0AAJ7E0F7_9HYME|nr:PREDICTED: 26S proteasome non-ATPase regulatory subunit 10-like isoform X1 [Ceratosolen solmsi marchali]
MAQQVDNGTSKPFDMAYRGHFATLKALINQNSLLITQTDENCRMLLHWAALGGHDELVDYLLLADAPVDAVDDMGMTPLILAASAGRHNVVNTLLKNGANINAKTWEGHSALQYAASKNWKLICTNLLAKGADVNIADIRGATPLHRAVSKGNINIVKLLLTVENLIIDQQDFYGNTALHLACEENRLDEAKLLISSNAVLTIRNKEKKIPLDLCNRTLFKQLLQVPQCNKTECE